eukprot:PhM_4_TR8906/c0_g1_i1/m.71769
MAVHFNPLSSQELDLALRELPYHNKNKVKNDLASLAGLVMIGACDSTPDKSVLLAFRVSLAVVDRAVPGSPQLMLQVTLGYQHPNAYPSVMLIVPSGWKIKEGQRNVDTRGVVYLAVVSSWNPSRSNLRALLDEAVGHFGAQYPLTRSSSSSGNPSPQAPPVSQPPAQQRSTTTDGDQNAQRQRDMAWLEHHNKHVSNQMNETPEQMAYITEEFRALTVGAPRPADTVITTPRGFGFGLEKIRVSSPPFPLKIVGPCPVPLHAVTEPTPEQMMQAHLAKKEAERAEEAARDASAPKTGWAKASSVLLKGAHLAGEAYSGLERKVWEEHKVRGEKALLAAFPRSTSERFVESYWCSHMVGDGKLLEGTLFITDKGVHFMQERPKRDYRMSVGYTAVVSLARGRALDHAWLHVIKESGELYPFTNFSSVVGTLGTVVSGLKGTASERAYNWMDHMWRAATEVPRPSFPFQGATTTQTNGNIINKSATDDKKQSEVQPAAADESLLCVVCMDAQRGAFFQPCGHMVTCMECSSTLNNVCPMCRATIEHVFVAYT